VNDLSGPATRRYQQGWRALNRLLHEDRAFSGKERDCAFLNCGGDTPSFATVSNVTGFNFADDGRGLATADWDFDGDPDVWLTARTAPRVRFVKNNTAAKPFVAFKLQGTGSTNRDAIGARLELHLRGAGKKPVRINTLRGGEGFLSQSSNWIHFGLGDAAGIEKLVVRWPGGKLQEITGLSPGRFYRILQGNPVPAIFTPPPGRQPLAPSVPQPAALDETARIIVPPGLPLPQLATLTPDGTQKPWEPKPGNPVAINIWAPWCSPCVAELTEWAAARAAITGAGLEIMACDAGPAGDAGAKAEPDAAAVLRKTGFPFAHARLSEASLHALDLLQRAVLDRWKPLPLPCTFLVDGRGELIAIYKGRVSPDQLLADLPLASASAGQRRDAAIPFRGVWIGEAGRADPQRVANLMLDHNDPDAAIEYLDRCVKVFSGRQDSESARNQLGDIHYLAGLLQPGSAKHKSRTLASLTSARDLIPGDLRIRQALAQQLVSEGRFDDAAAEITAAIGINPSGLELKSELADIYERAGQIAKARPVLEEILRAEPKNAAVRYRLAGVLMKLKEPRAAIGHYKQTLTDAPRTLEAANDLARLLAASPDEAVRAADEAVALAQRLCAITKEQNAAFLDTLAIALANKGDYPGAAAAARKALALIPSENRALSTAVSARLKLYGAGQPYRLE